MNEAMEAHLKSPIKIAIEALEAAEKRFSAIDRETNDEAEILCREALQALRDKEFVCVLREPTDEVLMTVERSHWNELISAAQPKE